MSVKPMLELSQPGRRTSTVAVSEDGTLESSAFVEARISIDGNGKPENKCKEEKEEAAASGMTVAVITSKLKEALVSAIPQQPGFDIHDLNKNGFAGFMLAGTYLALYISVLLAFAVTGTQTEYYKKFLALDYSATSVCNTLPVSVTGTFEGDLYGAWSTNPAFFQNSSLYVLRFTGSAVKLDEYQATMRKFSERLKTVGQRTATKDLSYSLVAWAAFNVNDAASRMSFYTTAKADIIFSNMAVSSVAISSRKGVCQKTGLVGSFDRSSSTYTITVPKDAAPVPTPTNAPHTPVPTPVPSPGYMVTSFFTDSPTKCSSETTLHQRYIEVPGECVSNFNSQTREITGSRKMLITSGTTSATTYYSTSNCKLPPTPAPTIAPTPQPSALPTFAPPADYYVSSYYGSASCTGRLMQPDTLDIPNMCRPQFDSSTRQPTGSYYQFVASGTSFVWTSYSDSACTLATGGTKEYGPYDDSTCTPAGNSWFVKKSILTQLQFSHLSNTPYTSYYDSTAACLANKPYQLTVTASTVCFPNNSGSYTQSCLDDSINYVFYSDSSCQSQTSTSSYPGSFQTCQSNGDGVIRSDCSTQSAVQPTPTPAPSPAPTATPNSPFSAKSVETTYLGACVDVLATCDGGSGKCPYRYYTSKISYEPLSKILPPNAQYTASYTSLQSCLSNLPSRVRYQVMECHPAGEGEYIKANCEDDLIKYQAYSDVVCSQPIVNQAYAQGLPFNCSRGTYAQYDSNGNPIPGTEYAYPEGTDGAYSNTFCSSTTRPLGGGPPTMEPTALTSYKQEESCPDQFSIFPSAGGDSFMGVAGLQDGSAPFTLSFDIRAVTIILAVNLGTIEYSDLLLVKTVPDIKGGNVVYEYYIDTFYLGMPPIVCLQGYTAPGICFYSQSDELFYPVLTTSTTTQAQYSLPMPTACTCPSAATKPECSLAQAQEQGLQLSFFFGNKPSRRDRFASAAALATRMRDMMLADPVSGDDKVRAQLTSAPYIAALFAQFRIPADQYKYWLKGSRGVLGTTGNYNTFVAAFDAIGQTDISAATFILKPSSSSKQINDFNLELSRFSPPGSSNTACLNSIYHAEALAALAATPPVAVTEKYLQCHSTLSTAASASVGSANGNASLAASLFLTVVSSALILYLNSRAKSAEEKILPPATKKARQEQQLVETVADLQRRIEELRKSEGATQ